MISKYVTLIMADVLSKCFWQLEVSCVVFATI